MALGGIWSRLTGGIVALGVGAAARDAIDPVLEVERQQAWARRAVKVLEAKDAAELEAEGFDTPVNLRDDAKRHGIGEARFLELVRLAQTAPTFGTLLTLLRRRAISDGNVRHGLKKAKLEDLWVDPLLELVTDRLAPADVANAIQQGFIPGDGILPADPGGTSDITPPVEQVPLDPQTEAETHGIDAQRLSVLAQLAGLPPGPMELLEMWRRGIITETAVERGIREGHTKTKWTSAYKALFRPLLNPAVVTALRLRGWIGRDEQHRRLALHGLDGAQADDMFDAAGRPMAPVQAFTAFFRNAPSPSGAAEFTKQDFLDAIRRSDIRPEYGEALWGIRHAYPSLFQLRRAVQDGSFTPERAKTILRYERYEDQDADALLASWTKASGATGDPHVTKAQVQLWGTAHRSYIASESNADDARQRFDALSIPAAAQDAILALWESERELIRKQLTPAQIKKAFQKMSRNYATGQPWTRDDALAALMARGYSVNEANDYLDIPSGK